MRKSMRTSPPKDRGKSITNSTRIETMSTICFPHPAANHPLHPPLYLFSIAHTGIVVQSACAANDGGHQAWHPHPLI